jgi:hypothetical protein
VALTQEAAYAGELGSEGRRLELNQAVELQPTSCMTS